MLIVEGIFWLIGEVLSLYWWAVIIAAVLSNLLSFGVLDRRNRLIWSLGEFFYRVTEPLLAPIRRRRAGSVRSRGRHWRGCRR